jgi:hypothetical protein
MAPVQCPSSKAGGTRGAAEEFEGVNKNRSKNKEGTDRLPIKVPYGSIRVIDRFIYNSLFRI